MFNEMLTLTLLCSLCMFGDVKSAKILGIFPMASPSHYILGNALMRGLAEAGHNVTVISPFVEKNPPKRGSYRDVVLTGFKKDFENLMQIMNYLGTQNQSIVEVTSGFLKTMAKMNDDLFGHENVQKLLNSDETFDVVIIEQFLNDAMKVFGHIYNVPVITFTSLGPSPWVNSIAGNPSPLSYIPQLDLEVSSSYSDMTITEKMYNVFSYLVFQTLHAIYYYPKQNKILKKHFPNAPNINDLYYNVSLILLNSHESLNQPVPSVPNMVQIGGYHVRPPKKLPEDLQEYLDNAKEGVVYFSLGSNLNSKDLPSYKRDVLLKACGKLKEKVLWKWEDEDLPGKPPNVKIAKWLPQQDILAHPNVKLFITHCGLLSLIETVYHGVPILAIPVCGDQYLNAQLATFSGYALSLPYQDPSFSEEKILELLQELLTNSKYRDNAKKRSQLFHDRPQKPMDTAVYWVEYVIRTGGAPQLRVAGVEFPWFEYHSLDVISFLVAVTSSAVYILYIGLRKILRCWNICEKVNSKSKND